MLRRNRLPVPAHRICRDETEALRAAESLGYPVVIKPADKDGGIAVRADLRTPAEVSEAFAIAEKVSKLILVEQYVTGKDYRLTVFGNTCVWAIERQPAVRCRVNRGIGSSIRMLQQSKCHHGPRYDREKCKGRNGDNQRQQVEAKEPVRLRFVVDQVQPSQQGLEPPMGSISSDDQCKSALIGHRSGGCI